MTCWSAASSYVHTTPPVLTLPAHALPLPLLLLLLLLQGRYEYLRPKATSLARRVPQADEGMLAFLAYLLQVCSAGRGGAGLRG